MVVGSELKKAGLSDKEIAVYLASLALGPASVQVISRRARVARGTTYITIDKLLHQGLMTQFVEGKRKFFVAEPPQQILRLMEKKQREFEQTTQDIVALLPKLLALAQKNSHHTVVRYYAGPEGLAAMRREMLMYSQPGDIWYNLTPVDQLLEIFGEHFYAYHRQRTAKHISAKTIFTTKSLRLKAELLQTAPQQQAERKFISPRTYRSASGFTVYRDRVAVGSFKEEVGGIIIESLSVSEMMRQFFNLCWDCLDPAS